MNTPKVYDCCFCSLMINFKIEGDERKNKKGEIIGITNLMIFGCDTVILLLVLLVQEP